MGVLVSGSGGRVKTISAAHRLPRTRTDSLETFHTFKAVKHQSPAGGVACATAFAVLTSPVGDRVFFSNGREFPLGQAQSAFAEWEIVAGCGYFAHGAESW